MSRKRYSTEQIITKLREAEVLSSQGHTVELSENSVRLALLAVTLIRALYKSHVISHSTHLHLGAEVASCVGPGKPRATPSTRCPSPKFQKASFNASGSYTLDHPVAILDGLEKPVINSPAQDCHSVAQKRFSAVLEMEESAEMAGETEDPRGDPRSYP